ncbi:MAG TPA: glycosyltransferase family 9 protein [Edaphobacter sp.]|nr:glycosyltransferase family 9 protein [Edaphobacter sp.]
MSILVNTDSPLDKNALIVKIGQIGDVIMAIPGAYALYRQGFKIDWICGRSVYSLLSSYAWINPLVVDEKDIFFGNPLRRMLAIGALWKKIAMRRYDLCATLYYDRRYKLLTLPIVCNQKQIFSRGSRQNSLIAGRHHTDEYARILLQSEDICREQSFSPIRPDRSPPSPLPPKRSPRRIALFAGGVKHLIKEQAAGLIPEQALRRWPVEQYSVLAQHLLDREWEVVLIGSSEDDWVRPYFAKLPIFDAIGTLTLPEVVSACDSCDAIVTHDTGPLHLAGLSTTCIVGIFGPTDPSTRVPRRNSVVGIWGGQGFACRPCYDGQQFAPCQFNACMHQVKPALVLQQLDLLLEERSKGAPRPWRIVTPEGPPVPVQLSSS